MRKIMMLSNYIYYALVKKYLIFAGGITVFYHLIMLIFKSLFQNKLRMYTGQNLSINSFLPYEMLLKNSGVFLVFLIGFGGIFFAVLKNARGCYTKSKSIYTLLTLPMPREHIYMAFLLSGITTILTFLAFQLFLFLLWYVPVMVIGNDLSMQTPLHLPDGSVVRGFGSMVNNGLFLAFVRSPFFRVFYPLDLWGIFWLILSLALILTATYYMAFSTGNRLFGKISVAVSIFLAVRIFFMRILQGRMAVTINTEHIIYIVVCIGLTIIFVYMGIHELKKAENL